MNERSCRVLIADDHPLALSAVRAVLEDEPGFAIVGAATNGPDAVRLCRELEPDLVLMDIRMPGMSGIEATRLIKQQQSGVKVVVLSVSDSAQDLFTAIQYGAQGYLLKSMDPADWLDYLHALLEEEAEGSRRLADKLFQRFRISPAGSGSEELQTGLEPVQPLTAREHQISSWVAAGATNRQIAEGLVISENTVKNHMKNILDKLGLENRVQLAAYAIKMGWTDPGGRAAE